MLSKQVTAMHQLYSVVFSPSEMRVNIKVGGRIPERMAVWFCISFLSVQQTLAKLPSREKGRTEAQDMAWRFPVCMNFDETAFPAIG